MAFLCNLVKRHVPDRTRVWDDGVDFRAPCRRCGTPMIKDTHVGWRAFEPARDYAGTGAVRAPRPQHR